MTLPLHDRAHASINDPLVRLTGGNFPSFQPVGVATTLIPERGLAEREQYRFHFDMTVTRQTFIGDASARWKAALTPTPSGEPNFKQCAVRIQVSSSPA